MSQEQAVGHVRQSACDAGLIRSGSCSRNLANPRNGSRQHHDAKAQPKALRVITILSSPARAIAPYWAVWPQPAMAVGLAGCTVQVRLRADAPTQYAVAEPALREAQCREKGRDREPARALPACNATIQLRPDMTGPNLHGSSAYLAFDRLAKAEADADRVIRGDHMAFGAFDGRGVARLRRGGSQQAIGYFNECLHLQSDYSPPPSARRIRIGFGNERDLRQNGSCTKGRGQMPVEWPPRFIYVCNASRASLVNFLPVAHAGIESIDQAVIFCGASGPDTNDGNDRAEAVDPALRLARQLTRLSHDRLSLSQGSIQILYGSPVRVSAWDRKMRDLVTETAEPDGTGLPVVFNLKGGTKEMAIGGVLGLATAGARSFLVTVKDQYSLVECVRPGSQDILPVQGDDLDLERYLETYGFREHIDPDPGRSHQQRAVFEALCQAEKERIQAFAACMLPSAPSLWPLLHNALKDVFQAENAGSDFTNSRPIPLPSPGNAHQTGTCLQLEKALTALSGFPGLETDRNAAGNVTAFRITDAVAARFLTGGWLEATLYLALRDALGHRNDVTVAAGLALSPEDKPDDRETELDVAVIIGSQLIIIEAKCSVMTGHAAMRIGERSLPQVENNKRMLGGQVCRALIANPCITWPRLEHQKGAVIQRAQRGGIELFLGPTAVTDVVEYVVGIAQDRAQAQDVSPAEP
ncbi:MAG: DUF1887 family CARF protein [Acetobacteraceae bacterium]